MPGRVGIKHGISAAIGIQVEVTQLFGPEENGIITALGSISKTRIENCKASKIILKMIVPFIFLLLILALLLGWNGMAALLKALPGGLK